MRVLGGISLAVLCLVVFAAEETVAVDNYEPHEVTPDHMDQTGEHDGQYYYASKHPDQDAGDATERMGEVNRSRGSPGQTGKHDGQYYYTSKRSDQDAGSATEGMDESLTGVSHSSGRTDQTGEDYDQYATFASRTSESVGSPLIGNRLLCPDVGKTCFRYNRNSRLRPECWAGLDSHILIDGPGDREFPLNSCCDPSGNFQSPINIHATRRLERSRDSLKYDQDEVEGYLQNNGVYYKYVVSGRKPILTGAPNQEGVGYFLDSVHFHIGKRGDRRQTEHLIYGKSYSAEAHIVHHRQDYEDLEAASAHPDGLLVISVMFELRNENSNTYNHIFKHFEEVRRYTASDFDNVCTLENRRLAALELAGIINPEEECVNAVSYHQTDNCGLMKSEPGCGEHITGIKVNPRFLLPNIPRYYYYEGGLTSPPCSEAVLWLVGERPKMISQSTVDLLYQMETRIRKTELGDYGNLRPLQKRRGRSIRHIQFE
ncbi:putative carbonic anhydrase 1 [Patella vulgata]|uniref:putative carbonic anhydrase 1 n=1 Tax=Patella vulgata TaxID=6465 RepID=UPI0024A8668A|nr:putative carbonic anhydrase 1 [Patella vulgata]